MRHILVFILAAFYCQSVSAYELQRARNNFAEDLGACTAYFVIAATIAKKNSATDPEWEPIYNNYVKATDRTLAALRALSIPEKRITAKIDLYMQEELKVLDDEGMDRLMVTYKDMCKSIVENPKHRIDYWINKN